MLLAEARRANSVVVVADSIVSMIAMLVVVAAEEDTIVNNIVDCEEENESSPRVSRYQNLQGPLAATKANIIIMQWEENCLK